MLTFIPPSKDLPPLSLMLDDMGRPSPAQVARVLDVEPAAVARWVLDDMAPRPAALSLFWVTRWGRSLIDAQAVNGERMARGMLGALERENARLRGELARLLTVGDFGSANDPAQRPRLPAPAVQLVRQRAA